jgi:hypothetical protein
MAAPAITIYALAEGYVIQAPDNRSLAAADESIAGSIVERELGRIREIAKSYMGQDQGQNLGQQVPSENPTPGLDFPEPPPLGFRDDDGRSELDRAYDTLPEVPHSEPLASPPPTPVAQPITTGQLQAENLNKIIQRLLVGGFGTPRQFYAVCQQYCPAFSRDAIDGALIDADEDIATLVMGMDMDADLHAELSYEPEQEPEPTPQTIPQRPQEMQGVEQQPRPRPRLQVNLSQGQGMLRPGARAVEPPVPAYTDEDEEDEPTPEPRVVKVRNRSSGRLAGSRRLPPPGPARDQFLNQLSKEDLEASGIAMGETE